ncbi:hypothetical protein PCH_Pc22g18790 [Penicillium rubens Wisconsin 54-1255]|jgi:hypothetical protein|uniref:F-box domain-containing protein n=1 Tax=Penicillium rubens (strain ATCC 28089 / DSM 1075 / NRRL 1951 / Wisconsin 54-1255) TaxID=500485 RepID=B6HV24_PENRW|nr:hypothetical protein PCH_Pc22g18790 [Penicillium rubens Wisconsin 54-1255]
MPSETEHPEPPMPDLPPKTELNTSISDLPLELMDQIINLLDIQSQVYLALSCRSLYRRYQHVLAQDEFAFPRYQFGIGWLPFGVLAKSSVRERQLDLRRQLLCRLQGPRRLYCSSCSKLHLTHEILFAGEYSTGIDHRCKYPGFVNVCPCSPLNIRAMAQMLKGCEHGWLEWHHCSVTIQPEVVADQKIYILEDEQTYLRVRSQWEITYNEETNDCPKIERFFGCPHVCMLPTFSTSRPKNGRSKECYECNLHMKTHWNEVDENVFHVEITRTLYAREILEST